MNELTDGTVCAVDAATGAEIGPSRKSRRRRSSATIAKTPHVSAVALALAVGLLGCSTTLHTAAAPDTSTALAFLRDGETTESQVVERLGRVMRRFPEGVVVYRLAIESKRLPPMPVQGDCPENCYDLVLVFDASGTLKAHSLLRVR